MSLVVEATGPLATVQDAGRPGLSDLGVGASGAADRGAARLANRLVGNPEDAAVLEATLGGLALRADVPMTVAATGAPGDLLVDDRPVGHHCRVRVPAGAVVRLGQPPVGVRTYLAVRGGIAVDPVLGSRSTDVLADLGPAALAVGDVLPVGEDAVELPATDLAPVAPPPAGDVVARVVLGPRHDWFTPEAVRSLLSTRWAVGADSNRVGMRLEGPAMERAADVTDAELPSEGVVRGSLQIASSGRPTLFLADHPVTGGYPVAAVVLDADTDALAQVRVGQHLRFRATRA
ncbi:biotin-dependent carboxyltransferase family protein [Actinomycetospora atypica]|uniref:Biotin-dependent carboxyltransferase family protein n=1 Tax=Actinomycetospora atypica TaxID=1290095 RepID=A0ABV9YJI0_9PSEU